MRRGVGVLAMVLMLGALASIVVMATHTMWRGSSRTLFSVQEHRQLLNLARSSLAEAAYTLQTALDNGTAGQVDFCLDAEPAEKKLTIEPEETRAQAAFVDPAGARLDPGALAYTVSAVKVTRARALDLARGGALGALDLEVSVHVRRAYPAHAAEVTMTERHAFRLADDLGPHARAGRHVELLPTPSGTEVTE